MNKLEKVLKGLELLQNYSNHLEIDNIPSSFANSAPNHSHSSYIIVEVSKFIDKEIDLVKLYSLGWAEQNEGQYWIFHDYQGNIDVSEKAIILKIQRYYKNL